MRGDTVFDPLPAGVRPHQGPSYGPGARIVFGGLLAVSALFAVGAIAGNAEAGRPGAAAAGFAFLLALGLPFRFLFSSQTAVDDNGLRQSWLMPKRADWGEIRYARFIEFPLANRLIVVKQSGMVASFYSGSPELDAALRQVAAAFPRPSV